MIESYRYVRKNISGLFMIACFEQQGASVSETEWVKERVMAKDIFKLEEGSPYRNL